MMTNAPTEIHTPDRPNIVLIMADDLGYGDISCYSEDGVHTPNIDRLARQGVRFTDYHSNGAVCSPTRAALMTGRYQQRCGIEGVVTAKSHRDVGLSIDELTFAKLLSAQGYDTAIYGKWHLGYEPTFSPMKHGFDEFVGYVSGNVDYHSHIDQEFFEDWWHGDRLHAEIGYTTDLVTERAVDFLERASDQPFCLYLSHEAPHYPYQGREDAAIRQAGGPIPDASEREDKGAAYREMIEALDEGVGRVMRALHDSGKAGNTLVIFCSDNGASPVGSNAPLRGGKASLWEGGHRVPAIAWWPGVIAPGRTTDEIVLGMDFFPTFARLAGADLPEERPLDGVDLTGLLASGDPLPTRTVFWRHGAQSVARRGRWKFLDRGGDDTGALFDLERDMGEQHDMTREAPELAVVLAQELRQWNESVSEGVERVS